MLEFVTTNIAPKEPNLDISSNSSYNDIIKLLGFPIREGKGNKHYYFMRYKDFEITIYKNKIYSRTWYNNEFKERETFGLNWDITLDQMNILFGNGEILWRKDEMLSSIKGQEVYTIGDAYSFTFDSKSKLLYSVTQFFD